MKMNEKSTGPFDMPHLVVPLQKVKPGKVEALVRRWSNVRYKAGV